MANIRKVNHRYRGPQESIKLLNTEKQIKFNIIALRDKIESLEKKITFKEFTNKEEEAGSKHKVLSLYHTISNEIKYMEENSCE